MWNASLAMTDFRRNSNSYYKLQVRAGCGGDMACECSAGALLPRSTAQQATLTRAAFLV